MRRPVALALRASGIGDLLTAVPALRALAVGLPGHRLLVAAPGWLAELVALVPGVGGIVPVDGIAPPPGPAPELAVNLHGSGPQSHEALLAVAPGELWAYRCPSVWPGGPAWDDGENERQRWCRLVQWYGVAAADPAALGLLLPATPSPAPGAVVVHLGGKDPRRRLGPGSAAIVAERLTSAGHPVVLTGGSSERPLALEVAAAAGLPRATVLAGTLGLGEVAALVAAARVVVSADTGVAHLASAYEVPSVVLFGPERVERWGPPERAIHRVLHGPDDDASRLAGPDLLDAVLGLLADTAGAAAARGTPAPGLPGSRTPDVVRART